MNRFEKIASMVGPTPLINPVKEAISRMAQAAIDVEDSLANNFKTLSKITNRSTGPSLDNAIANQLNPPVQQDDQKKK